MATRSRFGVGGRRWAIVAVAAVLATATPQPIVGLVQASGTTTSTISPAASAPATNVARPLSVEPPDQGVRWDSDLQRLTPEERPPTHKNPKADSLVSAIADAARASGVAAALEKARASGLQVAGSKVRLVIQASDVAHAVGGATVAGAEVEGSAGNLIQVLVAPGQLNALMNADGVEWIRPPLGHAEDAVTDEAVATTNAGTWHAGGDGGAGVKVAIIDGGFVGYAARQASGDLPVSLTTADFCSGQFNSATDHGTAVAEVVHKMAPAASLYLICVGTEVQLAQAVTYAKANGIQVINHSVVWFNSSRGDGSGLAGTPDATAADAQANGILWVNAAGNQATEHWSGTFVDDGSGYNLFAPGNIGNGFTVAGGATQCVFLKWDGWPGTSQDYDLLIAEGDGTVVAVSENFQTGSQPPTEGGCFTNAGGTQAFYVVIAKYAATQTPRFDLFLPNAGEIQYQVPAGSIPEPASSPATMAVGAACWSSGSLEYYSSQGPTISGQIKPELAGPDQVSTATYGAYTGCGNHAGFPGTSAAAPHVAGAAALVKAANPALTAAQIRTYLQASAQDVGAGGMDNQYGSGLLRLPAWPNAHVIFDNTGYFVPDTSGATYVALAPTRLLDSRAANGLNGPFSSQVARTFQVTGRGGVPANAVAVTGNLTVTQQSALGFIYLGPDATNNPTSSTLNFPVGDDRANGVTVALSGGGTLSATFVSNNLAATAHIIFDVTGYFVPDTSGATYVALAPTRLLDSRAANGLNGPFSSQVARTFQVTGRGGVPANAVAVTGNLTVTQQSALGFIYLGPDATNNPTSSTLNFPVGDDRANGVTVALSGGGTLSATFVSAVPPSP
jgi:hypothetical protein